MTEETPDQGNIDEVRAKTVAFAAAPDLILEVLVSLVARNENSYGITLWVPGAVVSGKLVGVNHWLNTLVENLDEKLAGLPAALHRQLLLPDERDEDEGVTWSYIHLVDARIFVGTEAVPTSGCMWRGRLSEVAGWSFGQFSTD